MFNNGPKNPGANRLFGVSGYNVDCRENFDDDDDDDYDDYEDPNQEYIEEVYEDEDVNDSDDKNYMSYTSHEASGAINQYISNDGQTHSHRYWANEDDFEVDEEPDYERDESDGHDNPESVETGCFLTSACMRMYKQNFNDDCYELIMLRGLRDFYCTKEEIAEYYEIAPKIVSKIEKEPNKQAIYKFIYQNMVSPSVEAIEMREYSKAHNIYKTYVKALKKSFLNIDKTKADIENEDEDERGK